MDAAEINDVFTSYTHLYTHLDNETAADDRAGWVSALHRAIRAEFLMALGRRVKVWRDPDLAPQIMAVISPKTRRLRGHDGRARAKAARVLAVH